MAISDKSRKILWARSGNACAICRRVLIVNKTNADAESVIAEECHIVSPASNGPRYELNYPAEKINDIDNLILLCRVHHKMVDDQTEEYTIEKLRKFKVDHEKWVEQKIRENPAKPQPLVVKRFEKNIPKNLTRIFSGSELFDLASGMHAHSYEHEEDLTEDEISLIGGFCDELNDWVDIGPELSVTDQMQAKKRINDMFKELDAANFWVFVGIEIRKLTGGILEVPEDWKIFIMSILRANNPKIQRISVPESLPS